MDVENITVMERLGGGNFGDVYRGEWNGNTDVALKKLKSTEEMQSFFREATALLLLRHPNIVQFIGVFTDRDNSKYIVTEFLSLGSLDILLRKNKTFPLEVLLDMATQICQGMICLEKKNIIHRDLALRNILVTTKGEGKYLVKVSDFGMSRSLEASYYKATDAMIPVRWSAIEALSYGQFSTKSDVWSMGVVLWELLTYGMIPYVGMNNQEIIKHVSKGNRLEKPALCPEELYQTMRKCWSEEPSLRPTFTEINQSVLNCLMKTGKAPQRPPSMPATSANYSITYASQGNYN